MSHERRSHLCRAHHSPQRVVEDDQEDAVEDEEVCSCSKDCDFLSAVVCNFPVPVADAHTPALDGLRRNAPAKAVATAFIARKKRNERRARTRRPRTRGALERVDGELDEAVVSVPEFRIRLDYAYSPLIPSRGLGSAHFGCNRQQALTQRLRPCSQ
jgi:hypothetical protein